MRDGAAAHPTDIPEPDGKLTLHPANSSARRNMSSKNTWIMPGDVGQLATLPLRKPNNALWKQNHDTTQRSRFSTNSPCS